MEVTDFVQYRRLFYFFQYAFAVRGNLAIDPFDTSNLLNVMQELAQDPEWFHIRNEYMPAEPISSSRRNKPDLQPNMPISPSSCKLSLQQTKRLQKQCGANSGGKITKRCGPVLYIATSESQYRDLMLNNGEWLKTRNGRIWKDFINLYRALLIFDLYQDGETANSICEKYGGKYLDEYLEESLNHNPSIWISAAGTQTLLETLIPFLMNMLKSNCDTKQFLWDYCEKNNAIAFVGSGDETDCAASYRNRIRQHYKRALQLISLAETGAFKTFPLVISPIQ